MTLWIYKKNENEFFKHFFFLRKRKLSPYRACGVVGQSPTVLKEKQIYSLAKLSFETSFLAGILEKSDAGARVFDKRGEGICEELIWKHC